MNETIAEIVVEQDQDYAVVHKGDVEIRVDSTRWNKVVLKPHGKGEHK